MSTVLRLAALVLITLALLPKPVLADAVVVGRGTAASCTQVSLQIALDAARARGGGAIRFRCGPTPVTIALMATLTVPNNTAIDGGGLITLDGSDSITIIVVEPNTTVLMKNLTFRHGRGSVDPVGTNGGAVFNQGRLTIDHGTFSANNGELDAVVYNVGTLAVKNTVFSDNAGVFTILNRGPLVIVNSSFSGNGGGEFGGGSIFTFSAFDTVTPVTIENSRFSRNQDSAVVNHSVLTVKSSTFSENEGAGIHNLGLLTVENSLFSGNVADEAGGGGITNNGDAKVSNSSFVGNRGGAGAISSYIQRLTIENCALIGNAGSVAGGIFNAGDVIIRHSIITRNVTTNPNFAGGIYTCCGGNPPVVVRSVVAGNEPNDIVSH